MKKRKLTNNKEYDVYDSSTLRVNYNNSEYFFEIGSELTNDIAEAVSIMMRKKSLHDDNIWNMEISKVKLDDITPEKALFWLTGGYSEWRSLENYKKPWCDCYLNFQEEFGFLIINIVKRSKTLSDIRDNFIKYLNLPVLYDFAISKDMVK